MSSGTLMVLVLLVIQACAGATDNVDLVKNITEWQKMAEAGIEKKLAFKQIALDTKARIREEVREQFGDKAVEERDKKDQEKVAQKAAQKAAKEEQKAAKEEEKAAKREQKKAEKSGMHN